MRYNYGTPERLSHTLTHWIEDAELAHHRRLKII